MTPGHQCGSTEEETDEQHFSRYRERWTLRLGKRTDDWALKSRLLESLEVAYRTPVSVLSNEDLKAVKDSIVYSMTCTVHAHSPHNGAH